MLTDNPLKTLKPKDAPCNEMARRGSLQFAT